MTYNKFLGELDYLDLGVIEWKDGTWCIGRKDIANHIISFNPLIDECDYDGGVNVKSINSSLYNPTQIKDSLYLVNELLMTPIEERGNI